MKRPIDNLKLSVVVIAAAVVFSFFTAGCPSSYHTLVTIEHDAASTVSALQSGEKSAFAAGELTADEHALLEAKILKVAQAGAVLTTALQSKASSTTITGDISVIVAAIDDLNNNGVLGVKNPTAKAALSAAVQAVEAVLANLQTALQVKS